MCVYTLTNKTKKNTPKKQTDLKSVIRSDESNLKDDVVTDRELMKSKWFITYHFKGYFGATSSHLSYTCKHKK